MAANTSPIFLLTANIGKATLAGNISTRDGTSATTIFTAGSNGSRIEEIVIMSTGDPADCVVTFYLHDGSNYFMFDEWDIGNPAAGSTTVAAYRESRTYPNLVLPTGWTLRGHYSVTATAGGIQCLAFGGDY